VRDNQPNARRRRKRERKHLWPQGSLHRPSQALASGSLAGPVSLRARVSICQGYFYVMILYRGCATLGRVPCRVLGCAGSSVPGEGVVKASWGSAVARGSSRCLPGVCAARVVLGAVYGAIKIGLEYASPVLFAGALAAMTAGGIVVVVLMIVQGLFANGPIIYGILTSLVVFVVVSLLTRQASEGDAAAWYRRVSGTA
jgi:hypothetical protein